MAGKRITPAQQNMLAQVRANKVQQYTAETGGRRWLIAQADAAPGEARSLDTLAQRGSITVLTATGSHSPVIDTEGF